MKRKFVEIDPSSKEEAIEVIQFLDEQGFQIETGSSPIHQLSKILLTAKAKGVTAVLRIEYDDNPQQGIVTGEVSRRGSVNP